jgi:hypothetical protein
MKKLVAVFCSILSLTFAAGSALAFETAQPVTATAINAVPFVISTPGNYYLAHDLTFSGAGVAIVIAADEVVLDLNGRSLNAAGAATSPNVGIGIAVLNHEDCIIQNGDINKFGAYAVLLDATDGKKEHNQKNRVQRVNFNNDEIGVLTISGSINVVEDCDFDGGAVGIYDIASKGGDRFQKDNFENENGVEAFNLGVGIVSTPGGGTLTEDCLFSLDSTKLGFILQGLTDKFRFCSFVGFSANGAHAGGIEEGAGDL